MKNIFEESLRKGYIKILCLDESNEFSTNHQ